MTLVKDPLLAAARIVLVFFIAVLGLAATAITLGAPAMLIFKDRVLAELAAEGAKGVEAVFPALPILMLGIAALLALGVYFLILLRRIVNSVGDGDPFIPENATRLARMGWLALVGQVASIPIGAAVVWIARMIEDEPRVRVDEFGFSGEGILLMLILFILARVFRRGTEMREELEGTV